MQRKEMTKIMSIIFVVQLILLAIFPTVNNDYSIWKIIVWSIYAILSIIICCMSFLVRKNYQREVTWWIVAFMIINIISVFWGISHGVAISDSIRGVLPFIYFIYIYIMEKLSDWKWNMKYEQIIAIIGIIQALTIIGGFIYFDCAHTLIRITLLVTTATRFTTIYGVIYFFSMYICRSDGNKKKGIVELIAMMICWGAIVLTETKSMLIAACLGIFVMLCLRMVIKENRPQVLLKSGIAILALALVIIICFASTDLGRRWSGFFTSSFILENGEYVEDISHYVIRTKNDEVIVISDSASRLYEIETAVQNWKTSPIFGKGCGYKYVNENIPDDIPRRYMHNLLAWMLMDYGIVGIMWLIAFGFYLVKLFVNILKIDKRQNEMCLYSNIMMELAIIIAAFGYANLFAVFRTIDFIFVFAVVVGAYCVNCKKIREDRRVE